MADFMRRLVWDFSNALSSDAVRQAQDCCLEQANDFQERTYQMWQQGNTECAVIWERIEAIDYFTYFNADVKNIMNMFKLFGPEWRESEVANNEGEAITQLNQFKYPNISYLARTAERFMAAYDTLSPVQQSAIDYVFEPYVEPIILYIQAGACKAAQDNNAALSKGLSV